MKEDELQALIAFRLERAAETLIEAFYAVSALLAQEVYVASKHTGIKAMFNQHFVKTGVVTKENGRLYNRLFNLRQEGDYVDFVSFEAETIEPLIEETAEFIDKIKSLLTHKK